MSFNRLIKMSPSAPIGVKITPLRAGAGDSSVSKSRASADSEHVAEDQLVCSGGRMKRMRGIHQQWLDMHLPSLLHMF